MAKRLSIGIKKWLDETNGSSVIQPVEQETVPSQELQNQNE